MKIIIVFVVVTALAAVAGSVIVGVKYFDGTVTESPYEEGLLWDEAQRAREELGWSVEIESGKLFVGENEVLFSVKGKDGESLNADVTVITGRPATDILDSTCEAELINGKKYMSRVRFPLYGYWDMIIRVEKGEKGVSFKKRVFIEKRGPAQ